MARHKRKLDKPTPAGCLKGDGLHSGDENVQPFSAPEEKAAETRGQPLTGKITLDQYLTLVNHGYSGDEVRRWTAYHADQEIQRKQFRVEQSSPVGVHPRHDQMVQEQIEQLRLERERKKAERQRIRVVCPVCGVKTGRLVKHMAKVHSQSDMDDNGAPS
jgi:hypothetical protein